MRFAVERNHSTVISIRMEWVAGWEQWFLLRSDAHHDNQLCNQELEKRHLDQAKERGAGILDFGDLFCAMQGKWDKRSDQRQARPELQVPNYLDTLVAYCADFYAPYAENWVLLAPGNHEMAVFDRHQTNLSERLAECLRAKGSPVQVGTYQGWARFMLTGYGGCRSTVRLRYTHGYAGGGQVTRDLIQANRQMVYTDADILVSGHCFSEDTEILTPAGWKRQEALRVGDFVATMNKETRAMEFNAINSVHRYTDYRELLHYSGQGWDALVTPQHGMLVERYRTGRLLECTAEDLNGVADVVWFNSARAVGEDLYGDNELRLLAWVLADGYISGRSVQFHLKKGRKIDRLLELLASMGYTATVGPGHNGAVKISLCVDQAWWIAEELGQGKETIPMWLYSLNWRQSELFVLEYAYADGTFYKGTGAMGFQLYSSHQDILDLLQALCARAGFRASMKHREDCSRLNVCRRGTTVCQKAVAERVPYEGIVWCVNVDNGTLLVRRNGIPFVTQNTHDAWHVPIRREVLLDSGRPVMKDVDCIKCGGYKDEYSPGQGWSVQRGHAPKPLGAYWLRFYVERGRVRSEARYEVLRAK